MKTPITYESIYNLRGSPISPPVRAQTLFDMALKHARSSWTTGERVYIIEDRIYLVADVIGAGTSIVYLRIKAHGAKFPVFILDPIATGWIPYWAHEEGGRKAYRKWASEVWEALIYTRPMGVIE